MAGESASRRGVRVVDEAAASSGGERGEFWGGVEPSEELDSKAGQRWVGSMSTAAKSPRQLPGDSATCLRTAMSLLPYVALPRDPNPGWDERPPSADGVGEARPINAEPDERVVQATLACAGPSGEVIYDRNVPLRVCCGVRLPLKAPADTSEPDPFSLYGMVAEPRDEGDFDLIKDCAVVAAAWPWSRRWHDYGYFKPPADKGATRTDKVWRQALRYRGGWREYLREEATVNLFSQQRGLWKAVLFDPNMADENVIPGREYSLPRPEGKRAGLSKAIVPSIYWGLCDDLHACTLALTSKETSPSVHELVSATVDGHLFKKYFKAHRCLDPRMDTRKGTDEFNAVVHPTLQSEDRANDFMNHAIRVALAGPEELDSFPMYPGLDGRPRRLVATQVQRIYLALVHNAHRRACGDELGAVAGLRGRAKGKDSLELQTLDKRLQAELEDMVASLHPLSERDRRLTLAEAMQTLVEPGPVRWHAGGRPSDEPATEPAGDDSPLLCDASLKIAALAQLGVVDPRARLFLLELRENSPSTLSPIYQFVLNRLRTPAGQA